MDLDYLKETHANTSLDEFFKTILKLKTVPRQGWKSKLGLQNPESVADHCFSMTAMAMVLSDIKGFDTSKVIRMSLLHDLAEAITGDLTPEQTTKSKKDEIENSAMRNIMQNLEEPMRTKYMVLWEEYQKNITHESQLLHQVDKLEMALQADQYEKSGIAKAKLASFFESAKIGLTDPDLQKFLSKIYK
jgi:putative hydrolase of HD superfamily